MIQFPFSQNWEKGLGDEGLNSLKIFFEKVPCECVIEFVTACEDNKLEIAAPPQMVIVFSGLGRDLLAISR